MRVGCPHCHAAYNLDDRRVPSTGLNVRCPKCRETFPVRPAADAPGHADRERVRLPGGVAPVERAVPLAPPASVAAGDGGVPLPAPRVPAGGVPLPIPDLVTSAGVPLPPPMPAAAGGHGDPFAPGAAQAHDPFGADVPDATDDAIEETPGGGGLGFGEVDLAAGAPAAAEPAPPSLDDTDPFAPAPAPGSGSGSADPFAAPPAAPAPSAPPAPVPSPPSGGDDLEMLFGEGARARPAEGRYRVRLPSGKVVGPFDAGRVMELLSRGELAGTEEVSRDGEDDWTPIGETEPFADAVARDGGARRRGVRLPRIGRGSGRPRLTGLLVAVGTLAIVLAVGIGAGFTPHGYFFAGALRGRDATRTAGLVARARAALAKGDYAAERAALDLAAQAVAADPDAREAAALHAIAVASLELRHGAPPAALEQARRAADRLADGDAADVPALAARLAVTVASGGGATAPQEAALEHAAAKVGKDKDAELVALLARAALARGDAAAAAARFEALDALEPRGARGRHGVALAAIARGDPAGAKVALEAALARDAGHLPARLALAALAEAAGDAAAVAAELTPLLAKEAEARLGPAERARALALRAALLARSAAGA
ncbi:MAG TPA: zinc-ribbon domain-containing protein, partial [Anaeromyxobacter sp.]|nr:zinc-ribbon domain-containing protein [Anaeromyxobacter sp.]